MKINRKPPFLKLERPRPAATVIHREDGSILVTNDIPIGKFRSHILEYLDDCVVDRPDQTFLAQRTGKGGPWRYLTYGQAGDKVRRIAQALLDRGLGADRPVMILSANSIEHALLMLAALQVGAPVVPVSPSYSLLSQTFEKLRHIHAQIRPGLVFTQSAKLYERALNAIATEGQIVACVDDAPDEETCRFADLVGTEPTPAVDAARAAQNDDTVAKILYTSGSTGIPKGVINTQRMQCSVQAMHGAASEAIDPDQPPIILDWLPWHHTYGGNVNFNAILRRGGTLYIDEGKPTAELFGITVANLRDVSPTAFSTVPAAFGALATVLENDEVLCGKFFAKLRGLSYGGAALPQELCERMQKVAVRTIGKRIHFSSGHGATETGGLGTLVHWETERVGLIGLPIPGTTIKLIPHGDRYEIRFKGPQVTPGYLQQPEATQQSFDEEGFLKIGDAVVWVDPDDHQQGLAFAGRISEDFKLSSGTWVNTGALRVKLIGALSPLAQDILITGDDDLGILIWPNVAALTALCPDLPPDAAVADMIHHPAVGDAIKDMLRAFNADNPGSSSRIRRAILMADPPSLDVGEITDKGYVNQRLSLDNRAALVADLFDTEPGASVLIP